MNNYDQKEQDNCLKLSKLKIVNWMVVGKEVGSENKVPHLQGAIGFKTMKSYQQVKDYISQRIHVETMGGSKLEQNYCTKDRDVFICKNFENLHEEEEEVELPIDPLENIPLWPWQEKLKALAQSKEIDWRTIHYIYEPIGRFGKNWWQRHMHLKCGAQIIGGTAKDMKHAVTEYVKAKIPVKILMLNQTRTSRRIDYEGIESVKDALFFSEKYESGMCIYNPPHIFIFSNHMPDIDALSSDRWKLYTLNDTTKDLENFVL